MKKRIVALYALLLPIVTYLFSALTNVSLVGFIFSGTASLQDSLEIFLLLPYTVFLNTTTIGFSLLLTNMLLITLYITLAYTLFSQTKKIRLAHGLSGSFFSIFSIGCVACGALLSPLTALSGIALPLALLQPISLSLGLTATMLLLLGIVRLYLGVKKLT